jgi:pimeloyl-ACP methyl ester carboxylesterase
MPTAAGIYYFAHGADDLARPPVILIHGAGGHHLYWPPQVRRLPSERILAIDLPGHGKSEGVGHHLIEDYAAGILNFMDALNLSRAVLVGHSMGGAIALQTAMQWPQRVLGLGLLGSAARLRVSPKLLRTAADPSKAPAAVRMVIENSFAGTTGKRLKELAEQRMGEVRSSVLYGDLLACEAFEPEEGAMHIFVPTLILFGAEDKMVPAEAGKVLSEQITGARFEAIPTAGHMVMLEQPEQVAGLLSEFLEGIRYQPGK